jgi:aminopeptidase N
MYKRILPIVILLASASILEAQAGPFTHADTLRGSEGPGRAWWDVNFYDLNVSIDLETLSVKGWNQITYTVLEPATEMQIDLQVPMELDSIKQEGRALEYRRDGDAVFVALQADQQAAVTKSVTVYYHGTPRAAVNPPWDGGFIWREDPSGNPWVATANQGLGASVWWPTKDLQSAEPDSQRIAITVPDPYVDVSNGRLRSTTPNGDGTTTYEWFVSNPINTYNVTVTMGEYAHWQEDYEGELGTLTMDFWPLAENEADARQHFVQARSTMACFEDWFGPYPWYEDGYKLIETPHLGMEHQSAVAYGNQYQNGYLGNDLSRTGQGLAWDYIIVHESAHEWWGNNITSADVAENWIHEGFAAYAENLYVECLTGSKEDGAEYVIGTRGGIANELPVVGTFGVQNNGSGDMYSKGANLLHTIRQIVNDDALWRDILRGLNETFWHSIVTGEDIEGYISERAGIDLSKVFDQYLRTTMIPTLEFRRDGDSGSYRWNNVVDGFAMPVGVSLDGGEFTLLPATAEWQPLGSGGEVRVDPNFYIGARALPASN